MTRIVPEKFSDYYESIWSSRWPELLNCLLAEPVKLDVDNPFCSSSSQELLTPVYQLDPASVQVALALNVQPGDLCLDLCSAPGGKALMQIFEVKGQGQWHLNDMSTGRSQRLKRVIREYVPKEMQKNIQVFCRDGSRWGLNFKDTYDRVLVDAPCSGERHLLSNPSELAKWSEKRTRRLAVRQLALACAGFDSLKPGGRMVYSTCSLSPIENDHVIKKLLKKRTGANSVSLSEPKGVDKTEYGYLFLPDKLPGQGPMYLSIIEKSHSI